MVNGPYVVDSKGKKRSVANSPTDTHYEYIDSRGRSHIISSGPTRKQAKREGRLGVGVCFGLAFVAFGAVAIHLRHGSLARSRSQLDADRASQLAVLVDALRAWDNASASSDARRLEHSAFVVDALVLKTRKVAERAFLLSTISSVPAANAVGSAPDRCHPSIRSSPRCSEK